MEERELINDMTEFKILIKTWWPGQTEIPWEGRQGAQTSDNMGCSSPELWRDQPILFYTLELSGSAITLHYTQSGQLIASKEAVNYSPSEALRLVFLCCFKKTITAYCIRMNL